MGKRSKINNDPLRELPIDVQDGISTLKGGLDQMYAILVAALEYLPISENNEQAHHLIEGAIDTYEIAKIRSATKFGEKSCKIGMKQVKVRNE